MNDNAKWDKRLILLRISKYAIAVSLVLSIILAVYTYYGNEVGNFVINVNGGDHSITLCDTDAVLNGDYSECSTTLLEDGISDMKDISYSYIPTNIYEGIGTKNDANKRFLAFSFYLLNSSESTIDYTVEMNIMESKNNLDSAIRVMIIEGEGEVKNIYAKEESSVDNTNYFENHVSYHLTSFFDGNTVLKTNINDFQSGALKKYTIVIWIEGWDKDTNDTILNGSLKMMMSFTIL